MFNKNGSNPIKNKSKIGFWLKMILIIILIFLGYMSIEMVRINNLKTARVAQTQVQINFWKEEGLSDEEVQEKIRQLEQTQSESEQYSSPGYAVMRAIGKVTGIKHQ